MKDEIEILNKGLKRKKKKIIQALTDAKYYQHVSPKGLMKLYKDTGLRVIRVFKCNNRMIEVDRYSFDGYGVDVGFFYSSYKSDIIQKIFSAEEALKDERELYLIESPLMNDVRIETYVDSILVTKRNRFTYSVKFKKGNTEWIQVIDDLFKYEES